MTCPHGALPAITKRPAGTARGYRRFRGRTCPRECNERPGTPVTRRQDPTALVCLVIFWRFRYTLSVRDLAEMGLQRGLGLTHDAGREWEMTLTPLLRAPLRKRRHGAVGKRWYADETYVKIQGPWGYLSRAIDRDGHVIGRVRQGMLADESRPVTC